MPHTSARAPVYSCRQEADVTCFENCLLVRVEKAGFPVSDLLAAAPQHGLFGRQRLRKMENPLPQG